MVDIIRTRKDKETLSMLCLHDHHIGISRQRYLLYACLIGSLISSILRFTRLDLGSYLDPIIYRPLHDNVDWLGDSVARVVHDYVDWCNVEIRGTYGNTDLAVMLW